MATQCRKSKKKIQW